METNATPAPAHRYDRTDTGNRRWMASVLGEPVPSIATWTATPRAFTADTPSKASSRVKPVTRSHRHHSEVK